MASSEPVHPLRISKNNGMIPSPTKKLAPIPRPLSEISPSEKRRNSPSWNQTTKKLGLSTESSPFQSSPLDSATSPRLFWQNRGGYNTENTFGGRSGSPSPTRRSSIERLQKASRVKNSSILAQEQKNEYDPTKLPRIERPLSKIQGNSFGGLGIIGLRSPVDSKLHQRNGSKTEIPFYTLTKTTTSAATIPSESPVEHTSEPQHVAARTGPVSPSKDQASPIKSSLSSRYKSNYDESDLNFDSSVGEHDLPHGTSLHRHAKSVTFDAAPPQVNEYEMATPDLSSVGSNSREGSYESDEEDDDYDDYHYSGGDGGGQDDSFDASLEDTEKTPVVGPDDWRHDSPAVRQKMFDGSPLPDSQPSAAISQHEAKVSSGSSGEHRPLPPLPGLPYARSNSASSPRLSATPERVLGGSLRGLPSPPSPGVTKADLDNIGSGKMTLEERLKLMMLSDDGRSAAEQQRERRMRRAGGRDRTSSQSHETDAAEQEEELEEHDDEADDTIGELSGLEEYQLPPRISRESILRRANGSLAPARDGDYNFSSPPSSSPERTLQLDPDVPIPSTEHDDDSFISDEDGDDLDADIYDTSDTYTSDGEDEEDRSMISESDAVGDELDHEHDHDNETDGDIIGTPRAATPIQESGSSHVVKEDDILHAHDLSTATKETRVSLQAMVDSDTPTVTAEAAVPGIESARASTQRAYTPTQEHPLSKPEYDGTGWGDDDEYDEPGTPESVIHHPVDHYEDDDEEDIYEDEQEQEQENDEEHEHEYEREQDHEQSPEVEDHEDEHSLESPSVPERVATIKASGSRLKTRPSATPSDIEAMREARRQVSREIPIVPTIPDRHRNRLSRDMGASEDEEGELEQGHFLERHPSFKKSSLTLDLGLDLSLDKDFDRVIEAQKRGYLMRQNTKLVAASDKDGDDYRGTRSAGNSPVKAIRPQSWTVEPWNGQAKRKSIRKRSVMPGPVPPLPGQASNAVAPNALGEEDILTDLPNDEGAERGRLFVKVMGVKDLDLPIPRTERTWFSLTLDNGVHCVTTAWLELARNAPIGQEFELLVPNELEFQLTLNVKLEKPLVVKKTIQPAPKAVRPKASTFSRVFASPKKRKEMELRMREEEERMEREQREAQARLKSAHPTSYDLLSPIVAEDGSFARAYVCLKEHESRCYGRPGIVEVACFNEWATEEANFACSVKSKRGNVAVVRKAPYKIGKLELQLLFVPRPRGVTNDDMPKSMNSCIRELKAAEERLSRNWEGHLSQQGGDCPYWRRRYFKLVGTKLTAYHEATRQPRATINLANAKRLIDDRRALTEKETTGKNGKRRRSAFAEEEEGYMFVEEGFRIRFNNGEVIDFYADTAEDKAGWMKVLADVTSRDSISSNGSDDEMSSRGRSKWCELVFKREETLRRRAEGRRVTSRTKSMYV
ncbi:GTP-binding protein [Grosmannia clavigera kw1407]|uniref:GTP-binding protein n=1 Tax=Grosmannia clavigera (strain kw1407 / UAMH 11150) TaxID=655863 RepID=F0XPK9_GROCL|nr:GTP-binding protein [Grosmannia clavigera kw1407]EFX00168.1 GTP-binding protein [Grosmannia clavigera kw1407]